MLAKELSSISHLEDGGNVEGEHEEGFINNAPNDDLMFDQAIQDLNKLEEENCDLGEKMHFRRHLRGNI